MKIYYARRYTHASFHIHAGSSADMFYVPALRVAFGTETIGTFGSPEIFVSDTDYVIEEGEALLRNEQPKTEGISFSNIQDFDWNDWEVIDLIEDLKQIKQLKKDSKNVIEKIFESLDQTKITKAYEMVESLQVVSIYVQPTSNKIAFIKYIKDKLNIGLLEAKNICEALPKVVFKDIDIEDAKKIVQDLNRLGAEAQMQA